MGEVEEAVNHAPEIVVLETVRIDKPPQDNGKNNAAQMVRLDANFDIFLIRVGRSVGSGSASRWENRGGPILNLTDALALYAQALDELF